MERATDDPTGGGGDITIDLCAAEVDVPLPGGDIVRVNPREHRADTVRRLLVLGASEQLLTTLLPEWDELIRQVARDLRGHDLV